MRAPSDRCARTQVPCPGGASRPVPAKHVGKVVAPADSLYGDIAGVIVAASAAELLRSLVGAIHRRIVVPARQDALAVPTRWPREKLCRHAAQRAAAAGRRPFDDRI